MAVNVDLETAYKGDNYCSDPIQYKMGDEPFDLTNFTLKCQVRKSVDSGVIGELTPVVEDAKNCWFHLEAIAEIMAGFPTTGYTPSQTVPFYYDVQAYGPGGYTKTLIYGTFPVRPEVTR